MVWWAAVCPWMQGGSTVAAPIRRIEQSIDLDALVRLYPPAPEFFDGRWQSEPDYLEHLQLNRLKQEVERASSIPFFERLWGDKGFAPSQLRSLGDLPTIPSYSVDDIRVSIELDPPWGDYQGLSRRDFHKEPVRVYFSGGTTGTPRPTLYTMWDREVGALLAARAYYLAGLRPGDVVLNAWAYGTHNGGGMADEALFRWLGAVPVVTSTGQVTPTRRQVEMAASYGAASILTIGDYLLHMAEVASSIGLNPVKDFDLRCFPGPMGGVADKVEAAWGVPAYESYGFHEVGFVAAECPARGGLHIFEDAFIVEVVDVETGEPLPEGELGNLVVTCLYKTGSAQIRYSIQDMSRLLPRSQCECGSWMRKMDYFAGRSDNMVKLRGTNIWPEAIGKVATDDERVTPEYFVIAERQGNRDEMCVQIESAVSGTDEALMVSEQIADRLRAQLGVRIEVELVAMGALEGPTGRVSQGKPKRFEDRRGGPE
jgi:phenylacetate-CoA ligase